MQGPQESSHEGFLVLKEVTPLLSPEGRAGGNQVKGVVPALASKSHNSNGRCSQSPLELLPTPRPSGGDLGWCLSRGGGAHLSERGQRHKG